MLEVFWLVVSDSGDDGGGWTGAMMAKVAGLKLDIVGSSEISSIKWQCVSA